MIRAAERAVERWTDALTHRAQVAGENAALVAGCGILFLALVVGAIAVVLMSFGGVFSTYATIRADLPAAGASVALQSQVEYRDVTVGKVATTPVAGPGGGVVVTLHLKPSMLKSIPANVTATVAPISIFGNQYVVLEPPTNPSTGTLADGQTIPALTEGPTASVQTTLANLDYLLTQLHPAQLYSALSALADSLQGQGASLGTTLDRFNNYLGNMLPLWPKVVADLRLLVPVSDQLTASTPDILGALANFSTTSGTITSQQMSVQQLLSDATSFSNLSTTLLTQIQQPYSELVASAGPFLQDLSQTPATISEILQGLDTWARTWVAAESHGPYLTLTANVVVHNVADLALASLGGGNVAQLLGDALGTNLVNPPTYTAADCPRYGNLIGQGCSASLASKASASPIQTVSILAEPAQQRAVAAITSGLDGGVAPSSPAVSDLLLSPVLSHVVAP